ncbi:hypothetical protein GDO86_013665, partial [Hymenochirus boettgeri]
PTSSIAESPCNRSQSPSRQTVLSQSPGRPNHGGHQLPRGYIPIPVIHEGNVPRQPSQIFQQKPKSHYPQTAGDFQSHYPVYHKIQDERDSRPIPVQTTIRTTSKPVSSREGSPIPNMAHSPATFIVQPAMEKPQVQQIHREPPPKVPTEIEPVSPNVEPTQVPKQTSPEGNVHRTSLQPAESEVKKPPSPVPMPPLEEPALPQEPTTKPRPEELEPQQKHPGVLQVERILDRVRKLEDAVSGFQGGKNNKLYLLLEEELTKMLLALDSVDPEGRADVRQARRDGVRKVQNILETLEQKTSENTQSSPVVDQGGSSNISMQVDNTMDKNNRSGDLTAENQQTKKDYEASISSSSGGH